MDTPGSLLAEAGRALAGNRTGRAENLIRSSLAIEPSNPEALRLLATVASTTGHTADAEKLLHQAIARRPDFVPAYADLCALLGWLGRVDEAAALLERVMHQQDTPPWALSLKAATLMAEHRPGDALPVLEHLVARVPDVAAPWVNYAEALQVVGRLEAAVAAYRTAIALEPGNGFAWWGLANLRTIVLGVDDVVSMEQSLANAAPGIGAVQLLFALGKGLGDQGRFAESFRRFEEANRLRGTLVSYDTQAIEEYVDAVEAASTPVTFEKCADRDDQGHAPIFIVGMPRAGSTLVEQILGCHPSVEGLGELFELPNVAAQIIGDGASKATLPQELTRLTVPQLAEIGRTYVAAVQRFRRTDRPVFIDKFPANWQLVPLIRLILPNAKIIDVRRDPMACCFSAFTTYFSRRTSFPVTLTDLGRYYRAYTRMMDHLALVQPGGVYRLDYEKLIARPEDETRKLFNYLELPFVEGALRPQDNDRAIYTPSAQQVRRPINSDGLEYWRNYAAWLEPLKQHLAAAA